MDLKQAKQRVGEKINALQEDLWQVSTSLYENPELAFKEVQSAALLTGVLEKAGFDVEREAGGLETATVRVFSSSRTGTHLCCCTRSTGMEEMTFWGISAPLKR